MFLIYQEVITVNGFRINTNISSIHTYRQLNKTRSGLEKSLERLSSGLRINRASDDTAGLALSQRMRAEIGGLQQASSNASQSINMIQTAEGGLNEVHSLLTRMRELAVQASGDNITDNDRAGIDGEFTQLKSEITRIAESTEYDGISLLDATYNSNTVSMTHANTSSDLSGQGIQDISLSSSAATGTYTFTDITDAANNLQLTLSNGTSTETVVFNNAPATGATAVVNFDDLGISVTLNDLYDDADLSARTFEIEAGQANQFQLQIGADNITDNQLSFNINSSTASALSIQSSNVTTVANSRTAIDSLDTAIESISDSRSALGAMQNRLDFTISNIDHIAQNVQASESTIRDLDFAQQVGTFTKEQILIQAGTSMLAQANASSQSVLGLLG